MKNTLKMMMFALLALGMMACGEKKLTQEDLKKAEAGLFNEDKSMNLETAPKVAEKYCKFVEQSPDDPTAAKWLYHALEINVMLKNVDKSEELCKQLTEHYSDSDWAPMSLLLMGNFIYNDHLNDTARAHVAFQRLIDEYPESEWVDDAQKSIDYLGLTTDEIMTLMMIDQMEEDETFD